MYFYFYLVLEYLVLFLVEQHGIKCSVTPGGKQEMYNTIHKHYLPIPNSLHRWQCPIQEALLERY